MKKIKFKKSTRKIRKELKAFKQNVLSDLYDLDEKISLALDKKEEMKIIAEIISKYENKKI